MFGYFKNCFHEYSSENYDSVNLYSRVLVKFGNRALQQFMNPTSLDVASEQFLFNMLELTRFDEIDNEEEMTDFW